ncbi:hypothetical protein C2S51_037302 [Perilla frutescens var. frutescens]|nr:hypothetical protein C2S51_037302 [Perilla frutescens var. frutescens]
MHEQPIAIFGKSRDELEESVAEKEQNAIVVVNEVDIVILEKSGDEHEEFVDENEHNITLPEKDDTLDLSGSLIGFKRQSFQEMYELYCLHAREVGFSVRKNTQRNNSTGVVIEKYYVCSSERLKKSSTLSTLSGEKTKRKRTRNITRTDCKASLRVKRGRDGLLEVIEHIEEHNHELSRKEWSHMHKSHRSITRDKADLIQNMISSGMRANDSYRYMVKEAGGEHMVGHTIKDHQNFVNRMKMKQIEVGDAQSFVDMLCQDRAEDEGFFYRFKLDSDGRLSNVFWRDSMMCKDYHFYGDVLVFDTTYRTNKYNMIYAPFVGLNNHKKNVMFGCAFLTDEKIDTFEWLFEVFKKSMKLKCPVTIFTDQDLAITNALSKVFPDARHRLCIWHLYQNAVSRFGRLKGNKAFNDAFQRCLTGCVNKEEFERCWASMVSVHGLEGNTWFARLYDLREKWCTAYNKDYFSAGILSSQQSESTNNAIRFKARILKHASQVYTLSVFTDFEDELLKSISSIVNVLGEELEVRVYDVQNYDAGTAHRVSFFHGQDSISCTCRRFEEYGLLCSHSLRILDRNSVQQIPIRYIMKRWTKFAKKDLWDKVVNSGDRIVGTMTFNSWRHKMARQYYSVLIKAQESEDARMIIEEGSKKIFEAVEELNVTETLIQDTDVSSSCMTVLDPSKTTTKGRKKRIKGQLEKGRKKKTIDTSNSVQLDEFGSKTPNPRLF